MSSVSLKNPENVNLGLEAGGPKFTVFKLSPKTVVQENIIIEPVVVQKKTVVEKAEVVKPVAQKNEGVKPVDVDVADKNVVDETLVNKNIDEAKKLLNVAEKLANSVIKDEKNEVKKVVSVVDEEKPNFIIKFSKDVENLKLADEKKFLNIVEDLKKNTDAMVKIVSYYSEYSGRNVAFSRLLNARKVLLEKDIPTSQIMIMVLEDETKNSVKTDTVEVFVY